ncbi:MAG: response regulator [Nitrospirota bacterium]
MDDEKPFLLSLAEGLGFYTRYFNVITAESAKKAMEILTTIVVDLVVTDLKMPGTSGVELVGYIKKRFPNIPVIVMTAFGDRDLELRLHELGIAGYLEKPLDLETVVARILSVEKVNALPDVSS